MSVARRSAGGRAMARRNTVTPLAGIKAKVSAQTKVVYAKGCEIKDDSTAGFQEAVNPLRTWPWFSLANRTSGQVRLLRAVRLIYRAVRWSWSRRFRQRKTDHCCACKWTALVDWMDRNNNVPAISRVVDGWH